MELQRGEVPSRERNIDRAQSQALGTNAETSTVLVAPAPTRSVPRSMTAVEPPLPTAATSQTWEMAAPVLLSISKSNLSGDPGGQAVGQRRWPNERKSHEPLRYGDKTGFAQGLSRDLEHCTHHQ